MESINKCSLDTYHQSKHLKITTTDLETMPFENDTLAISADGDGVDYFVRTDDGAEEVVLFHQLPFSSARSLSDEVKTIDDIRQKTDEFYGALERCGFSVEEVYDNQRIVKMVADNNERDD